MKLPFAFLLACTAMTATHAQPFKYVYKEHKLYTEVGAFAGLMKAQTDLTAGFTKSASFNSGAYIGVLYKHLIGARLEYTKGEVREADTLNNNMQFKIRNLNYRSSIEEYSFLTEFHFLALNRSWLEEPLKVSPYLMLGVGYYRFNPQTYYRGYWYDLQPLRTEGQGFAEYPAREPYKLKQFNIPFGIGMRVEICKEVSFRLEFIYRYLFTDYLDDVSTTYIDPTLFDRYLSSDNAELAKNVFKRRWRPGGSYQTGEKRGGNKTNDAYYTLNMKFCVNIGREKSNPYRK
ncbi:MAG: hypothetical protein J0I41_08010 [Filimonas sp.]|nr:hypothetical protein [Filimonas sp.]